MFPAALVTLVTFLLDLTSSSPVYNMQPAFITTNIGSTNGRNIRNLPCISRKTAGLSGVCMFAIDCLKANGTHLGTCIDRFYFGSCCHIEPIKEIENSIETNIILDTREPPERIQNTTSTTSTSTLSSVAVSSTNKNQSLSTTDKYINKFTATEILPTKTPSWSTTSPTKPFGDKTMTSPSTSSTTQRTTTAQKLQTFQIVAGSSSETTTIKPSLPPARPTRPTTTPKPHQRPTTKPGSKPTQKPAKLSSTTKRPFTTATSKGTSTTKPTRRVTRPKTTVKPVTTTPAPAATTEAPTTKRPPTLPPTTTQKPTIAEAASTQSSSSTAGTPFIASTSTVASTSVSKKNITHIVESGTAHPSTNEIVGSSGPLTLESGDGGSTTPAKPLSSSSSSTVAGSSPVPTLSTSDVASSPRPSTSTSTVPSSNTSSSALVPKPGPGLITWTVEDQKNHTAASPINGTVATGNITEEWVPVTTPDGWVLLPSVTLAKNESMSPTSVPSLAEPLTTSIPPTEAFDTTTSSASPPSLLENTTTSTGITVEDGNETTTTPADTGTQVSLGASVETTTTTTTTSSSSTTTTTTESSDSRPVNMSDFTDVCGRRMWPEARIVGGEKSTFGKWPWQISLRQWRTSTYLHKCGAALLNENWAITAAHCVDNVPPSDLLLRLGEHDLSTEGEPYLHEERRVQIVASHPQFDPRTFEYDLALLRFYEPVQFQPNIIPVCVPKSDENFVGRTAYVTGWGRLYEDGPLPSVLQEVSVPVINNSVCESMYKSAGYIEHIPHIFICAGWRKGGFDSCEGDSGGPMVIQREDRRFLLAGVISWGIGCAEPNQPGVYTRISEFRDWINQILQF